MITDIEKALNQLKPVEETLLVCYGPRGRAALIQQSLQQVMLTKDCMSILSSIQIARNHVYNLIVNSLRAYSRDSGDHCKTYFLYATCLLKVILPDMHVRRVLNRTSLACLADRIDQEWTSYAASEYLIKIDKSTPQLDQYLDSLCVLHDLDNFNKHLASVSIDLVKQIIRSRMSLHSVLDNLNMITFYSEGRHLDESKFFCNGFLVDKKLWIDKLDARKERIKLVFVVKEDKSQLTPARIELTKSFDMKSQFSGKFLMSSHSISFASTFLAELKANKIDLVISEGGMNEIQKSQLSSIGCSLISYLERDYIDYLCATIQKLPLEPNESITDSNVIEAKSVQTIEKDKMYFIELTEGSGYQLASIRFCSSTKLNYDQFRIYCRKVIKTWLSLLNGKSLALLKCGYFEYKMSRFFDQIHQNLEFSEDERQLFGAIKKSLANFSLRVSDGPNEKRMFIRNSDQELETYLKSVEFYEPYELKARCFIESLSLVQTIAKIDRVIPTSKLNRLDLNKNDDDSD